MTTSFFVLLLGVTVTLGDNIVEELANANNLQFTPAIYKELVKSRGSDNFLVSPLSAQTALAFTQSGCKGETAREFRSALRLPDDNEKIETAFKTLLPTLKPNEFYALNSANKIYVKENLPLTETFKKTAVDVYQAESENIDFAKNEEAAKTINGWVEKQTNNKIHDLVKPEDLDEDTTLALINALYFKGNWSKPFELVYTGKQVFYKSAKDVVQVETMHFSEENFKYYECPHLNAKFLELPFKGADASMTIILPNEREGLAALESRIDRAFVPHNLTNEIVNVAIPKFKIESEINLKKIMANLGVKSAFDDQLADLSGISGEKGDLIVDVIRQKTFIDVSEEGVEAAAATLVLIPVPYSAVIRDPPPKNFIADHPFIFYVKIKGIIAFAGRVTSP